MKKGAREGHVSIPWSAYLAVGAGMSIYAKVIQAKNPDAITMSLFFWLGIIMVVVGAGKYLLGKEKKEEAQTQKKEQQSFSKQLHQQKRQWDQQQEQQQAHPAKHNIVSCSKCGTRHYNTSNFCHKCGSRLR